MENTLKVKNVGKKRRECKIDTRFPCDLKKGSKSG